MRANAERTTLGIFAQGSSGLRGGRFPDRACNFPSAGASLHALQNVTEMLPPGNPGLVWRPLSLTTPILMRRSLILLGAMLLAALPASAQDWAKAKLDNS